MSGINNNIINTDDEFIRWVCIDIFSQYEFDVELLTNWQLELIDYVNDAPALASIIQGQVILGTPNRNVGVEYQKVPEAIDKLFAAEMISIEFRNIMLALIVHVCDQSYFTKVGLHRIGYLDRVIVMIIDIMGTNSSGVLTSITHLMLLALILSEFGVTHHQLQLLMDVVFSSTTNSGTTKIVVMDLLSQLFAANPYNARLFIFNYQNPLPFPLVKEMSTGCFTILSWFKLVRLDGSDSSPVRLMSLAGNDKLFLRVQIVNCNQMLVELMGDGGSTFQYYFNKILNLEDKLLHLAFTFDKHSNLSLYVDGEYCESLPCAQVSRVIRSWNKLYLTNDEPFMITKEEIIINNLSLLDTTLPYEWIYMLYALGPDFDFDSRNLPKENIRDLLGHLSKEKLVNLAYKFNDNCLPLMLMLLMLMLQLANKPLVMNHQSSLLFRSVDQQAIIKKLSHSMLKAENYLFQLHDTINNNIQEVPNSLLTHQNPASLYGAFFAMGGTNLLLRLLEISINIKDETFRDTMVYKTLELTFTTLTNSRRLSKEFELSSGPGILLLLMTKYKDGFSSKCEFNLVPELKKSDYIPNLLDMVLSYCGIDRSNPEDAIIYDALIYKSMILSFDLYSKSQRFDDLIKHINYLLIDSKYSDFNIQELIRMKFLRKFITFLESEALTYYNETTTKSLLLSAWKNIIMADPSVESIKSIASFILHSLYASEGNTEIGIIVLNALADVSCDSSCSIKVLRKFSRAITIHWILLLFRFDESLDVVQYAYRLLMRLLNVLGPQICKQFFQMNSGLDILTFHLKEFWANDGLFVRIFMSSFGIDIGIYNGELLANVMEKFSSSIKKIVIPETIVLSNSMVLNALYRLRFMHGRALNSPRNSFDPDVLTTSFDALRLTNVYLDAINFGFENITSLHEFFKSKVWLDGIVETLGHLRLCKDFIKGELGENYQESYKKLTRIIMHIIVSDIPYFTQNVYSQLDELTKKLILESILPLVFEHMNHFLAVSKHITNEGKYLNNLVSIIDIYNTFLMSGNIAIMDKDLQLFLECTVCVMEQPNASKYKKLNGILGEGLIRWVSQFDEDSLTAEWEVLTRFFLFRQSTITKKEILDANTLFKLIVIYFGKFVSADEVIRHQCFHDVFNFLRTCYIMYGPNLEGQLNRIDGDDYKDTLLDFFNELCVKNDEEMILKLERYPFISRIIAKLGQQFQRGSIRDNWVSINGMLDVAQSQGGRLFHLNFVEIENFRKESEQLKLQILSIELRNINRSNQDRKENFNFFISNYHTIKLEVSRLMESKIRHGNPSLVVDLIENTERMRSRLLVENLLSDSEKLLYNLEIPIKAGPVEHSIENLRDNINGLSISNVYDPTDRESFEIVDDCDYEQSTESNGDENKNRKVIRSLFMGDLIVALWNVSQINGLVPVESLLILGKDFLYLILNYYLCSNGNVIDALEATEDIRDLYVQLINSQSSKLLKDEARTHVTKNWPLDKISCISKRQFLLRDVAMEMFFSDGASILITFISSQERDSVYNKLQTFATSNGIDADLSEALEMSLYLATSSRSSFNVSSHFFSQTFTSISNPFEATKKWKNGQMSNFYYLMIINTIAGRTFNDLTQYPIFPWVIADYTSEELNLSDPRTYRDLSKPMGGQSIDRADRFKERFEALNSLNDPMTPPFHYGTHYSSAMIVTSYLIRLKPFVQSYLLLQGGKFDHAERLFSSVEKAWVSASRDNTTDVRELTPEFFYLPEFLMNANNFELGHYQSGEAVNDVELPAWAHGDPMIFVAKNREALESPYVSAHLHLWIDLIFGFKQNGPEAIKALNVFHHLSYNGAIDLDNVRDELEKRAIIGQINNFGQTPNQIFTKPHPEKVVLNTPGLYCTFSSVEPTLEFVSKLNQPITSIERSKSSLTGRPNCVSSEDGMLIRKASFSDQCRSLLIGNSLFLNVHQSPITFVKPVGFKVILTGSKDGLICVWRYVSKSLNLLLITCLRGHSSAIVLIKTSKSFKVGLSVDENGLVLMWDLARFKFIRQFKPPPDVSPKQVFAAISNDTGNIGLFYNGDKKILLLVNINGRQILQEKFTDLDKPVVGIGFGTINDTAVLTSGKKVLNNHVYWAHDLVTIWLEKGVLVHELGCKDKWTLRCVNALDFSEHVHGVISSLELLKMTQVDSHDKLCRGHLKLILGDSRGKVYSW
ncbi:uncharacterized protein KQ657_000255 [Scheffersomyces spartinae]|uniref:Uncharacterized protein n=1 Tax=Scheffersomyces spartinae TaxID=45513 RepID=A0A9P7VEK6_9ASCO|nr:uncharacterized protein KQ657_000255 [Scheffersomyces spartinae]KAG7196242.1 hypothetical protein KQ657_000255 [Scheffersomyces spartinae]